MTQNAQQLITPVNQVYLTVYRGKVTQDKNGGAAITRLVCAKHNGKFYIHTNEHKTIVNFNDPSFDFFMLSADVSAEAFIDRIKQHGKVNLLSEHWKETDEKAFKSGLENDLLDEYSLKDRYQAKMDKAA